MSDWSYGAVSSSVGPIASNFHALNTQSESYNLPPMLGSLAIMPHTTNSEGLDVIHLETRVSIGSGASGPAIQSPLLVSTGASQPPMHQASYSGFPSEYLTSQRPSSGYEATTADKSHVVPSEHSGRLLPMNSESVQRIMPHIPDIMEADGDNPSEFYGTTDDTISTFLDSDAATFDHSFE
jgi:hypothetical protein